MQQFQSQMILVWQKTISSAAIYTVVTHSGDIIYLPATKIKYFVKAASPQTRMQYPMLQCIRGGGNIWHQNLHKICYHSFWGHNSLSSHKMKYFVKAASPEQDAMAGAAMHYGKRQYMVLQFTQKLFTYFSAANLVSSCKNEIFCKSHIPRAECNNWHHNGDNIQCHNLHKLFTYSGSIIYFPVAKMKYFFKAASPEQDAITGTAMH